MNFFSVHGFNPNIHGMRGLAALLVFGLHFVSNLGPYLIENNLVSTEMLYHIRQVVSVGSSGVEFFFIISGFLITSSLLRHRNIKSFLLDRAIRIYPVFLSIHIPFFIIMPFVGWKWLADVTFVQWFGHFMSNALFLPGVFDLPIVQNNAWTLSYEFLFYLVCCFTYIISLMGKSYVRYFIQLMVVLPLIIIFPRSVYFLVGVISYFVLLKKPDFILNYNFLSGFLFLVICIMLGPLRHEMETTRAAIHATDIMTKLAVIPSFFFFIEIIRSKGIVSKILRTKLLQFLGSISYSLYLWHAVVLFFTVHYFIRFMTDLFSFSPAFIFFSAAFFSVVMVVFVSWCSYCLLENKLCVFLKSYKRKHL